MTTTIGQALHDTRDDLAADYAAGGVALVLAAGQGAKYAAATVTAPYAVRIDDELLIVTGRSTDTLTVVGAQGGTIAANHVAGIQKVQPILTAIDWTALRGLALTLEATTALPLGTSTPSAATLTLPGTGTLIPITSTTGITDIVVQGTGRFVVLQFAAALTVTNGNHLKLTSDYTTVAGDLLALVSDGTNWYELARRWHYATPSIVLGTAAAAGSSNNLLRPDATIVAFDATVPVTQALGDSAAAGSATVAARRDHTHGMPTAHHPLTNGGREKWQLGTSFATMADATYGPDRWQWSKAGTDAMTIAQEPTTKQADSAFSMKCTFTLGSGAGASRVKQDLKMTDGYSFLLGKPFSYADDVKLNAGVASAVRAFVQTDGTAGTTTFSSYHGNNTNWETLAVENVTVPTDATFVRVGLTFEATVTLFADDARAAVATRAPAYSGLHPMEDLARCQRYAQIVSDAANQPVAPGQAVSATDTRFWLSLPVEMGGTPSITVTSPTNFWVYNAAGGVIAPSAIAILIASSRRILLQVTVASGLVAGNATGLWQGSTGSILLTWNP